MHEIAMWMQILTPVVILPLAKTLSDLKRDVAVLMERTKGM
ncbi:MAG: hypothetical protein R3331_02120 [Sulfurospirillaceae bacterium]|nr:hypothetical protein [Sulfurospirillaceae bacterium]